MNFDFDQITERRGTNSVKWNVRSGELPMWIADMDFPTAPAVRRAIEARAAHGIFGYSDIPKEWAAAYTGWWERRHALSVDPQSLIFTTGVIPAISTAVRRLTYPAEKVLVMSPCYNIFYNSIYNNGRYLVENELIYEDGGYRIEWERLEEQLSDPQVTLMLLCNPHNPIGVIWDRGTLLRIGELCAQNHVTVISDEIHCDLVEPGCGYVPFASVSPLCAGISVTCLAPTKCFNLAGIQTAAVMVPDPVLRHKMWRGLNTDEVAEPNAFAVDAAIAAFTEGEEWLDALNCYLAENKAFVSSFLDEQIPQLTVASREATYLMWLYAGALPGDVSRLAEFLRERTGLYLAAGAEYGGDGARFLRLNTACPRSRLADGMERLARGIAAWIQEPWT